MRLLVAAPLAVLLAVGAAPSQADPIVLPDVLAPIDSGHLLSCTELVPHAIAITDKRVRLDLRILLDGVGRARARRAVTSMRRAYGPLGIRVAPSYEKVRFQGSDAAGLTRQAKRHYGGKRPRGTDIVYTMTSKDITAAGVLGDDVAGLADCIGGVRFARRAFAVGEAFPSGVDTGKTMAHEVGHLMGGHHHYTSPEGLLGPGANLLDLMGPSLSLISLRLSTLNSLMVRGHAQRYAA
ncbi:MAG TPA: zinc-dependent metalloprotease family protein [Nocardioides sp.]|nr:zinc-dependent metalloprotease family protein [Nocardioides sp.]